MTLRQVLNWWATRRGSWLERDADGRGHMWRELGRYYAKRQKAKVARDEKALRELMWDMFADEPDRRFSRRVTELRLWGSFKMLDPAGRIFQLNAEDDYDALAGLVASIEVCPPDTGQSL